MAPRGTEHRKAEDIQSEDPGQFFQPFSDPLFPMRVISSGSAIFPTEKRATHAPVDQMKRLNLIRRTNLRSLHPRHCLFLWLQTNFPLPSPQSHDRKSNCPQHFRLQGGWHRFSNVARWAVTCFPAGTPVLTPNGSVAIEDLKPGDVVLSRDQDDVNGEIAPQVIEKTFIREGELWNLQINGQSIRVTANHPLFVEGKGWIPAGEVVKGDRLATIHQLVTAQTREIWNENSPNAAAEPDSWECDWQEIESCESTGEVTTVYNFRVANWHTYFVGDEGFGLWVHNADYDLNGPVGGGRGLWNLTPEGASETSRHGRFGNFFKSKSDDLWWAADNAGHGGSAFKVFKDTGKGLEWYRDADQYGDFILGKHKGPTGLFIPWKELVER